MSEDPLSILALRYAARDLSVLETAAFEVRLATDKSAQDALAEAVRLSAAALGRPTPVPMTGIRGLIADRISPVGTAVAGLFCRRAYRGHPMAWAGLGATAAAVAVTVGVWLGGPTPAVRVEYASACPPPEFRTRLPIPPAEAEPVPTAKSQIPKPMSPKFTSAVEVHHAGVPQPLTSVVGAVPISGGGEASPPVNRPKTFIPDTEPPGTGREDMFGPFEPTTHS
ncbi:MAG TPA: hypothetical protein VGJ05_09675 [Fimbriiglobus sp.]|jgi:hypothetical protein